MISFTSAAPVYGGTEVHGNGRLELNFSGLSFKFLLIPYCHWTLVDNVEVVVSFVTAHNIELGCFVYIIGGLNFIILATVYREVELVPVTGNVEWTN